MAYSIITGDKAELEHRLNGTVQIGPFPKIGLNVGALTLVFTTPVATVTFSGSAGDLISLDQIVTEINAQVADLAKLGTIKPGAHITNKPGDGSVSLFFFLELTRAAGFTIDNTGTANALFGIASGITGPAEVASSDILGYAQDGGTYSALIVV